MRLDGVRIGSYRKEILYGLSLGAVPEASASAIFINRPCHLYPSEPMRCGAAACRAFYGRYPRLLFISGKIVSAGLGAGLLAEHTNL